MATGRKKRESLLDLLQQLLFCSSQKRAKAVVESKLFSLMPYKVQYGTKPLSRALPKPAAKLLKKKAWRCPWDEALSACRPLVHRPLH